MNFDMKLLPEVYNSSILDLKSFLMKDYIEATTVFSNIQVKFLNVNCVTSCGLTTSYIVCFLWGHSIWPTTKLAALPNH